MITVIPKKTQNNFDLVLQGYGSIDKIVEMCRENNVYSIDSTNDLPYYFHEEKIVNPDNIGYAYQSGRGSTAGVFNDVFDGVFA